MSTHANKKASTPPRREVDFNIEELSVGFASLEAEIDALDMEEELAEVEVLLNSEETRATFAALEVEMETACKELEAELQRLE